MSIFFIWLCGTLTGFAVGAISTFSFYHRKVSKIKFEYRMIDGNIDATIKKIEEMKDIIDSKRSELNETDKANYLKFVRNSFGIN